MTSVRMPGLMLLRVVEAMSTSTLSAIRRRFPARFSLSGVSGSSCAPEPPVLGTRRDHGEQGRRDHQALGWAAGG
jgi:hypothetical protein